MTEEQLDVMYVCLHCKMDKRIRNPSGYCDHLYYPESCEICMQSIEIIVCKTIQQQAKEHAKWYGDHVARLLEAGYEDIFSHGAKHQREICGCEKCKNIK